MITRRVADTLWLVATATTWGVWRVQRPERLSFDDRLLLDALLAAEMLDEDTASRLRFRGDWHNGDLNAGLCPACADISLRGGDCTMCDGSATIDFAAPPLGCLGCEHHSTETGLNSCAHPVHHGADPLMGIDEPMPPVWCPIPIAMTTSRYGDGYSYPAALVHFRGFGDASWGNDAAACLRLDDPAAERVGQVEGRLTIWCEHVDRSERESGEDSSRFLVCEHRDPSDWDGSRIFGTEKAAELVRYLMARARKR